MVSYLCGIAGVSRSGYYTHYSEEVVEQRKQKDKKDEASRDIILKAYQFKRRKNGARQIKITLSNRSNSFPFNKNTPKKSNIRSRVYVLFSITFHTPIHRHHDLC